MGRRELVLSPWAVAATGRGLISTGFGVASTGVKHWALDAASALVSSHGRAREVLSPAGNRAGQTNTIASGAGDVCQCCRLPRPLRRATNHDERQVARVSRKCRRYLGDKRHIRRCVRRARPHGPLVDPLTLRDPDSLVPQQPPFPAFRASCRAAVTRHQATPVVRTRTRRAL